MSETRVFTNVGTFTLAYDYNLAGQLKKITDASNTTINYGYDRVGRLTGVTGSDTLVAGVSTYASGFQYRAWGALKQVAIGTRTSSFSYNSVLRPTNFNISGGVVNQNYEYYSDGHLSFVHNTTDNNFDRAFSYDHVGRLTLAVSGGAARNDTGGIPMYETFTHDQFNNVVDRSTDTWSDSYDDGAIYTNHRRSGWGYDANGNVTTIDSRTYSYDAAGMVTSLGGQQWTTHGYVSTAVDSSFDGNGQRVREQTLSGGSTFVSYYLRSTVLGGAIVEEMNSSGQKQTGYVYTPSGDALATQVPADNYVRLKQVSPIGQSQYEFYSNNGDISRQEFDPLGADIPLHSKPSGHNGSAGDITGLGSPMGSRSGAIDNPAAGCELDGVWVPCSMAFRLLGQGAAVQCPANDCGPQARWVITDEGKKVPFLTTPFMAFANGESGYYIPGWVGTTPQAQADAGPALRALASGTAGRNIDSSFTQEPIEDTFHRLLVDQDFLKRFGHCLRDLFHVNPYETGFVNKSDGSGGSLTFKDLKTNDVFTVTSDTTLSGKELAAMAGRTRAILGFTAFRNPYNNFIASELANVKGNPNQRAYMLYLGVQVHEMGNSIAMLLGDPLNNQFMKNRPRAKDAALRAHDNDSGMALQECVFGADAVKQDLRLIYTGIFQ